jgi:SAM-dependent methyltransferase
MFGVPESEVGALGDVAGLDVVDLGCGTGYFSAWLARRGARPVGVDVTPAQLDTARRLQEDTRIEFPLIEASAEDVPLPDASFDLAFSEYGASIWCDPNKWLPEAHRLLRGGGRLVFLCNNPLVILCALDEQETTSETLQRPQHGMHRLAWSNGGVEFHLGHGDMFTALHEAGFEVENLIELYAPEGAETHEYYDFVTADWARKWPAEEIWAARKPS